MVVLGLQRRLLRVSLMAIGINLVMNLLLVKGLGIAKKGADPNQHILAELNQLPRV